MESPGQPVSIVGVGSGPGWTSVMTLLSGVPPRSGLGFVVFADAGDDAALRARQISSVTSLKGVVAESGARIESDCVHVVDRRDDATYAGGCLRLTRAAGDAISRAPVDVLFRSLGDELGRTATGVIVVGDGVDGTLGIKRIKEAGGLTAAASSTAGDAMSQAAIATGLVDIVAPVHVLGQRIVELQGRASELDGDVDPRDAGGALRDILTLMRIRTGHDFGSYKRATLFRRIARRMQVCQTSTLPLYLQHLRDHPSELSALLRDFLIGVTNFFRDREAFAALETQVLPRLFAGKGHADQVRVWVAGCATGEEAYSIAMLLLERAAAMRDPPRVQVFATDIDEDALSEARAGRYPDTVAADVGADRLDRFFTKEDGHYRVRKELRDRVLFSPHNLLRDPPFSRLDLVTCRNLLIYLNRDAQDRVLDVFHFGLRPDGFLFLGSSESGESGVMQFSPVDAKQRIYCRRPGAGGSNVEAMRWQPVPLVTVGAEPPPRAASLGELHHQLVERYAPPSVLVNDDLDVVHMSEHAGRYLTVGGGEPTRQILRLAHPALRLDLRTALYATRQSNRSSDKRVVRFFDEGRERKVELEVRVDDKAAPGRALALVLFREIADDEETAPIALADPAIEPVVRQMEDELHRTRDQLRLTVEQYETSLEELKASNEELHAINEELRSATEELETSREELQSVNEELTTLNHELQGKVDEVSRANGDLQNLMSSTDIGVLFLDREAHVKRFTERTTDIFNVIASDIGRPLAHLTHQLDVDVLPADAERVIATLRPIEREVRARDGRRYLARVLPYRSLDDRIDGVVMTFVNVTDLKRAEDALREQEAKLTLAERAAEAGSWDFDSTTQTFALSDECARLFGLARGGNVALATVVARIESADRERFSDALARAASSKEELDIDFRVSIVGARPRSLWSLSRPTTDARRGVSGIVLDISERRRTERDLRDSERRIRLALRAAPIMLLTQDLDLRYTWGFVNGEEIPFVGRRNDDVFRPAEAERLNDVQRAVLAQGSRDHAELTLAFDGRERRYEAHVEPILEDGAIAGLTTVAVDVTASKDLERSLREADSRKDEFLATLAHELRTPLAPLRSSIDVLRIAPPDPPRLSRSLDIMDRQLTHLVRLVDDLLDVARISEGKIQLRVERTSAQAIIDAAMETVRPAIQRAGHALSVHVDGADLPIEVDPARMVQVLSNLLHNAIKYTAPNGRIAIEGRADASGLKLTVTDNGVGLDARMLDRVFDLFVQRVNGQQGGLGIGLSLVRMLVTLHGGTASATSDGPGKGSQFTIRVPQPARGPSA